MTKSRLNPWLCEKLLSLCSYWFIEGLTSRDDYSHFPIFYTTIIMMATRTMIQDLSVEGKEQHSGFNPMVTSYIYFEFIGSSVRVSWDETAHDFLPLKGITLEVEGMESSSSSSPPPPVRKPYKSWWHDGKERKSKLDWTLETQQAGSRRTLFPITFYSDTHSL